VEDLGGLRALVTGASRGVGASIAIALAAAGADVAIAARSTSRQPSKVPGTLDAVAEQIDAVGRRAVLVPTDLTHEESVVDMVATAAQDLGGLDIVVNNAAFAMPGGLEIDQRRFKTMMAVNARAPLVVTREAVQHLRRSSHGRILNISSAAASYAVKGLLAYGMSKVALEHLSVSSARLLEPDGIAVNCFRIDIGTASEGMTYRNQGAAPDWEPPSVAAEGALWMLRQPRAYTGRLVSMAALRAKEGIMATKASAPTKPPPGTPIFPGLEIST
jgi:citronellol/citronellal dehydrogenase